MPRPFEVISLEPWGSTSYQEALEMQQQQTKSGHVGWILFCCPPTITLGTRGDLNDILVSREMLEKLKVQLLNVDRGGQVTYHGPGQIIGFPVGTVESHTRDPRGVKKFLTQLQCKLKSFIETELLRMCELETKVEVSQSAGQAGVYIVRQNERLKILSIGMGFGRSGMRHGFALNVQPLIEEFSWIQPCGAQSKSTGSLFRSRQSRFAVQELRKRLEELLHE